MYPEITLKHSEPKIPKWKRHHLWRTALLTVNPKMGDRCLHLITFSFAAIIKTMSQKSKALLNFYCIYWQYVSFLKDPWPQRKSPNNYTILVSPAFAFRRWHRIYNCLALVRFFPEFQGLSERVSIIFHTLHKGLLCRNHWSITMIPFRWNLFGTGPGLGLFNLLALGWICFFLGTGSNLRRAWFYLRLQITTLRSLELFLQPLCSCKLRFAIRSDNWGRGFIFHFLFYTTTHQTARSGNRRIGTGWNTRSCPLLPLPYLHAILQNGNQNNHQNKQTNGLNGSCLTWTEVVKHERKWQQIHTNAMTESVKMQETATSSTYD